MANSTGSAQMVRVAMSSCMGKVRAGAAILADLADQSGAPAPTARNPFLSG